MKAIIHIGAPKAGSSTLQEFLLRNVDALLTQGFRYHRNIKGRRSHLEYPLAALARLDVLLHDSYEQTRHSSPDLEVHKALGQSIEDELARNVGIWTEDCALISSENILPWLKQPEHIRSLDTIMRKNFTDVLYVLYLRNPLESLTSEYSESIKRGGIKPLHAFLPRRLAALDQCRTVNLWATVVGREALSVRLLDPGFLVNGDLITDYCTTCGIDPGPLVVPPRVNESLTAPAAECLRILNKRVPQILTSGEINPLRKGLMRGLSTMSKDMPRITLSPEDLVKVAETTHESEERLRVEYFPDRPTLYSPANPRQVSDPAAISEMAIDLAMQMIIKLRMGEFPVLSEKGRSLARVLKPGTEKVSAAKAARAATRNPKKSRKNGSNKS